MSTARARRQQPITGDQFMLLMQQLRAHAGIRIESPQGVVEDCVYARMAAVGTESIGEYLSVFDDSINARAEWLALIDLLTVKETRFFRQPAALDGVSRYVTELVASTALPQEISFWSAGCSSGQELYSIAMVVEHIMRRQHPWLGWHGIGTDISFHAVNRAQQGYYPRSALRSIPEPYSHSYACGKEEEQWRVSESIRARTHFFHSNLLHVNSAPFSDFNIIFCQNVLIYFEHDTQLWIIDQLVDRLKPGGLLVLGAGEDVRWKNLQMRRLTWPGVSAYLKLEV